MVNNQQQLSASSINNNNTNITSYIVNNSNYLDVLKNYQQPRERVYQFKDGIDGCSAYLELLQYIESPKYNIYELSVPYATRPSWGCLVNGETYECKSHGVIYKPKLCGMPKFCVVCGDNYTKARVGSAMRLFNMLSQKIPDLYIQSVVFTLPKELQTLVCYKNFKQFQQLCKSVLDEYHGGLNLAGFQTSHTWHSSNPLGGWFPHIHSFWLNVAYDKAQSQFIKVDHYLDVRRLNSLYKKALFALFGIRPRSVNLRVHYEPFTEDSRGKIYNSLKYALRMYQLDLVKYSNYNEISHYTEEEKKNSVVHLLPPRSWRRTQWFGWLADGVRKKYLKLFDISNFQMKEKRDPLKERPPVCCPICFNECVFVESNVTRQSLIEDEITFHYPMSGYLRHG